MNGWCSVCNGLENPTGVCPQCNGEMVYGGKVSDYFGPYSPYDALDFHEKPEEKCLHVVYCPICGWDEVAEICIC
jgi:hypothetical protein